MLIVLIDVNGVLFVSWESKQPRSRVKHRDFELSVVTGMMHCELLHVPQGAVIRRKWGGNSGDD